MHISYSLEKFLISATKDLHDLFYIDFILYVQVLTRISWKFIPREKLKTTRMLFGPWKTL